jgi:hypothetical protein
MIDRKAPRSKVNPGVGDVYADPKDPNKHVIVSDVGHNGRIYMAGECIGRAFASLTTVVICLEALILRSVTFTAIARSVLPWEVV